VRFNLLRLGAISTRAGKHKIVPAPRENMLALLTNLAPHHFARRRHGSGVVALACRCLLMPASNALRTK
jgi:hypothetical protein